MTSPDTDLALALEEIQQASAKLEQFLNLDSAVRTGMTTEIALEADRMLPAAGVLDTYFSAAKPEAKRAVALESLGEKILAVASAIWKKIAEMLRKMCEFLKRMLMGRERRTNYDAEVKAANDKIADQMHKRGIAGHGIDELAAYVDSLNKGIGEDPLVAQLRATGHRRALLEKPELDHALSDAAQHMLPQTVEWLAAAKAYMHKQYQAIDHALMGGLWARDDSHKTKDASADLQNEMSQVLELPVGAHGDLEALTKKLREELGSGYAQHAITSTMVKFAAIVSFVEQHKEVQVELNKHLKEALAQLSELERSARMQAEDCESFAHRKKSENGWSDAWREGMRTMQKQAQAMSRQLMTVSYFIGSMQTYSSALWALENSVQKIQALALHTLSRLDIKAEPSMDAQLSDKASDAAAARREAAGKKGEDFVKGVAQEFKDGYKEAREKREAAEKGGSAAAE